MSKKPSEQLPKTQNPTSSLQKSGFISHEISKEKIYNFDFPLPVKKPEVGSADYYCEIVFSLSADIKDVSIEYAGEGVVRIYVEVHYLDGVPTEDLLDYIRSEMMENHRMIYHFITVHPMHELQSKVLPNDT